MFRVFRSSKQNGCLYQVHRLLFSTIEEWKEVPRFPNYHVSTLGNVKNIQRNKLRFINYDNYRNIGQRAKIKLFSNSGSKIFYVSRLILSTFCPVDNYHQLHANHIDGNPYNNSLDNLEWMTHAENQKHAHKIGIGGTSGTPIILAHLKSGKDLEFASITECYEYLVQNTSFSHCKAYISRLCQRKLIRNGYKFRYANERKYDCSVDNKPNEQWAMCQIGCHGWEYLVSNLGRIKLRYPQKEVLKKFTMLNGYWRVTIRRKTYYVHRLVAQHHVPNANNYPMVDHIDTNRLNNNASNLRWVSGQSENQRNPNTLRKRYSNKANTRE